RHTRSKRDWSSDVCSSDLEWQRIFTAAWQRLHKDYQHNRPLPLNDYGLTNPAEFFAVCSETFFEAPAMLHEHMPEVYRLLCQFRSEERRVGNEGRAGCCRE